MELWCGKRVRHYNKWRYDWDSKRWVPKVPREGIVLRWFEDGWRAGKMWIWFDDDEIELRWISAFEETDDDDHSELALFISHHAAWCAGAAHYLDSI